jgi:hypothetical protein
MDPDFANATAPEIPEDDGFSLLPPWSVPAVESVVAAARELRTGVDAAPLWEHSEGRNLLRVRLVERALREPVWLELALQPALLGAVTRYLGSVPLLTGVQLWISPYAAASPDGRPLEDPWWFDVRTYHCDWGGLRQVRALVYADDVTPDHGPLTVVPARPSAEVRRVRRYRFDEKSCTLPDPELFALVDRALARPLCGPRGTIAFVDTCRCFHQGSRVRRPGLERLVVMFQYVTVTSFKLSSERVRRPPLAEAATAAHSPLQRMVLGAR